MSATLNFYSLTLAVGDATQNNNPQLRYADWKRSFQGLAVSNPKTEAYQIAPGVEQTIFDGTRATAIDGTTAFSLSLSPLDSTRYRFTATAGTAPGFRTDRGLNLNGIQLTLTVQSNGSLTVAAGTGTPFTALQVGDQVFVPGLMTGDASSPFNALNQGLWVVQGAGGASITLVRQGDFQGISETVTPTAQGQVLGFSSAGVQVGDGLNVTAGFAAPVLKGYHVVAVTPTWVEVQSTVALAAQTGVTPGNAGMQFYQFSKRFVQIEIDQLGVARLNGDTSTLNQLQPWVAGDPTQVAPYVKVGPTWKLTILNQSTQTLNAVVISAE